MTWILSALYAFFILSLCFRVFIRQDITGPARLAWLIAFVFLPVAGSIIYLVFGEVYLSKDLIEKHRRTSEDMTQLGAHVMGDQHQPLSDIAPEHHGAFRYTQSVNGFAPTRGNRFELLDEDGAFVRRLVADIDAAHDALCILYYIWLDDNTGTQIANAVTRAAQRGVECRILVDEVGSRSFIQSSLWANMINAGAKCYVAMPIEPVYKFRFTNRFDLRNHRKITVIDGRIAYCGSRNCADPEFRIKPKYAPWVDIITRAEGPCVNQMLALFAVDWVNTVEEATLDQFAFNAQPLDNGALAQARGTGPLERKFSGAQAFVTAIYGARRSLMITTPYFVPDTTVLNALCEAALSGVEVTLNLPANNDSFVVAAASRSNYLPLLKSGVKIYEYTQGLLHSKILTIDGVLSKIGSSNLDLRSLGLNYENDMLIYDQDTTATIHNRQLSYLRDSIAVDVKDVEQWSAPRRVWYNLVGTLGPLL